MYIHSNVIALLQLARSINLQIILQIKLGKYNNVAYNLVLVIVTIQTTSLKSYNT